MRRNLYLLVVKPEFLPSRGQYWRPGGSGYTNTLSEAGVFTETDDCYRRVAGNSMSYAIPVQLPTTLSDAAEQSEDLIDELQAEVNRGA